MKVKLVCHIVVNRNGKIASYTCSTNAVDSFSACHKHPHPSKTDITEIKHVISYMNMLHGLDISVKLINILKTSCYHLYPIDYGLQV